MASRDNYVLLVIHMPISHPYFSLGIIYLGKGTLYDAWAQHCQHSDFQPFTQTYLNHAYRTLIFWLQEIKSSTGFWNMGFLSI